MIAEVVVTCPVFPANNGEEHPNVTIKTNRLFRSIFWFNDLRLDYNIHKVIEVRNKNIILQANY